MSYDGPERREDDLRFKHIEEDVAEIKVTVKELHESFVKAQGAVTFVKYMAAIVAAGGAAWAWILTQINSTPRI